MLSWLELIMTKYQDYEVYWDKTFNVNCYVGSTITTTEAPWNISYEDLQAKIFLMFNDDQIEMFFLESDNEKERKIQITNDKTKRNAFR